MPDHTAWPTFERQLEALTLSLRHAAARPCLLIVAASDPATETEIAAEVRRRLAGEMDFTDLFFSPDRLSLSHHLRDLPSPPGAAVVMAFGLDDLPARARAQALAALNLGRETLRHVPYSVVLWLRPATLGEIQFKAPDFFAWRSAVYNFDRALTAVAPDRTVPPPEAERLRDLAARYREQLADPRLAPDLRAHLSHDLARIERDLATFDLQRAAGAGEARPGEPVSQAELRGKYLAYLANTYRWLGFEGILQTRKAILLPLDEIYIPLRATPAGSSRREAEWMEMLFQRRSAGREEEPERLSEGVRDALARHPHLAILGDPGSGKTTFLKYAALMCARGPEAVRDRLGLPVLAGRPGEAAPLPIILPLAAYADALAQEPDLPLPAFLPRYFAARGLPGLASPFERAIATGGALLLLDGLDEVAVRADRGLVARRVADFLRDHPRNRAIVTSRIIGYHEAPLPDDLPHFLLAPFSPDEIRQFAHQWCLAYELQAGDTEPARRRAHQEADKLIAAVECRAHIRSLATNPLLLTVIALIQRQGVTLPDHRVELYAQMTQTLVETWAKARSLEDGRVVDRPLREGEAVEVLAPLALWLHEHYPGSAAPADALREQIVARLLDKGEPRGGAESAADEFLALIRRTTGLLVERGQGVYGFMHLTFEEYLAARALVLLGQIELRRTWDALRPRLYDPTWHEVILLTVGHFAICESKRRAARDLITDMLDDTPPPGHAGENVVLAGRCLRDIQDPDDAARQVAIRSRVLDALQHTMQDPALPPRTRADAGEVLEALGRLPPDLDAWLPVPISNLQSPIFFAKYPVTNAQYDLFVQAGGYETPDYWPRGPARDWWQGAGPDRRPYFWDDPRLGRARRGYPVVGLTWYEAQAYAAWLTGLLRRARAGEVLSPEHLGFADLVAGLLDTPAQAVTLPGEAEWMAAAGGDPDGYPWGPTFDPARANTRESHLDSTTPVAVYLTGASKWGIMDLAGNVWEWTRDARKDGWVWLKGGGWWREAGSCRVGSRDDAPPDLALHLLLAAQGCRVCAR